MTDDDSPLRRWHRRKTASRSSTALDAREPSEDLPVAESTASIPEETDPPPDLPDIESLDAESDFSVFMADGVPEEIRRLALRKLWRLDPVLANVDGLVDYGEDFTDSALVVEGMKTAYRIGKGLLTDEDEETAEAAEPDGAEPVEDNEQRVLAEPDDDALGASPETPGEQAGDDAPMPSNERGRPDA